MNPVLAIGAAAAFVAQPIARPDGDVLEPSVLNEVRHAIAVGARYAAQNAPTNAVVTNVVATAGRDWFGTNSLAVTEIAVRLVSAQGRDGAWRVGTNDVTAAALEILRALDYDNE